MIRPAPPGERCALLRTRTGAEKRALSSGSALPPPFRTIHVISPSRSERGERGDTSADFPGQPMLSSGRQRKFDFLSLSLYWLTTTAVSSARLYWENKLAFFAPQGVAVPVAVSAFPDELYQAPRSWAEKAFPKLIHYNRLPKGGHFAAWEQPELFVSELRAAFKSLRGAN